MSDEKTETADPKTKPADSEQPQPKVEREVIQEAADAVPDNKADKERQKAFENYSKAKGDNKESMNVKVYSPSRTYFDGMAFSVSATNGTGEFDVLPKHHRFISLLDECDLIIRTVGEGNRKITISGGLMYVREDRVAIFLDI